MLKVSIIDMDLKITNLSHKIIERHTVHTIVSWSQGYNHIPSELKKMEAIHFKLSSP